MNGNKPAPPTPGQPVRPIDGFHPTPEQWLEEQLKQAEARRAAGDCKTGGYTRRYFEGPPKWMIGAAYVLIFLGMMKVMDILGVLITILWLWSKSGSVGAI